MKGFVDGSLGSTHRAALLAIQRRPEHLGRARHARGFPPRLDRRGRLRRAPGGGPRDRRARQRPHPRHLRQRRPGARPARPPLPDRARTAPPARRTSIGSPACGIIASMQPYHAIDDGRWAEKRIGPERIKTTYAFRSLLDRQRTSRSAPTGPSRRSIPSSASTRPSPGGRSTASTRTAGCRSRRSRWRRRYGPTRAATPTACSPSGRGAARAGVQGRSRPARSGSDPDPAGSHRAGLGPGDGRGRACRISGQVARDATAHPGVAAAGCRISIGVDSSRGHRRCRCLPCCRVPSGLTAVSPPLIFGLSPLHRSHRSPSGAPDGLGSTSVRSPTCATLRRPPACRPFPPRRTVPPARLPPSGRCTHPAAGGTSARERSLPRSRRRGELSPALFGDHDAHRGTGRRRGCRQPRHPA